MNDQQIVEYAPQHMPQVIEVISRGLREQKVLPPGDGPVDDEDLYHIAETYTERSRFWVCVAYERVIGTVAVLEMTPTSAQLKCMFVETAYQGRGIGRRLLDQALDFAHAQGYHEITLTTHPLMKQAHRFYERNGFRRVADERGLYAYQMNLS
jgi:ribosomal protein S18 acetylase RimI-like enzyme